MTAFGTLHPGYEAWESQLERLKAAGIRGLKLHPDFQHFWLQPMDGPEREANTEAAIAYCLANPPWRLSLQTHKMIGIA